MGTNREVVSIRALIMYGLEHLRFGEAARVLFQLSNKFRVVHENALYWLWLGSE